MPVRSVVPERLECWAGSWGLAPLRCLTSNLSQLVEGSWSLGRVRSVVMGLCPNKGGGEGSQERSELDSRSDDQGAGGSRRRGSIRGGAPGHRAERDGEPGEQPRAKRRRRPGACARTAAPWAQTRADAWSEQPEGRERRPWQQRGALTMAPEQMAGSSRPGTGRGRDPERRAKR